MKGMLLLLLFVVCLAFTGVNGFQAKRKATSKAKNPKPKKKPPPHPTDVSCSLESNGVLSQVPAFADGPLGSIFPGQDYSCDEVPAKYGNTYSFTAPQTATYQFDTIQGVDCTPETGIATVLQVLTSCHGQVLACADGQYNYDLTPGTCSLVTVDLVKGQKVLAQVSAAAPYDGFSNPLVFRLSVSIATLFPTQSPVTAQTKQPTLRSGQTRKPSVKPTRNPTTGAPTKYDGPLYGPVTQPNDALPLCSTPPNPQYDPKHCLDAYEYPLRAGFYDVVGQGYYNDYCRYIYPHAPKGKKPPPKGKKPPPAQVPTWYCLLSNTTQNVKIDYPLEYECTGYVDRLDWGCLFYRSPFTNGFKKTPRSYQVTNYAFNPIYHPVTVVYPVYFGSTEWLEVITGAIPPTKKFPYDSGDMVWGMEYFYRNIQDTAYAQTVRQYLNGEAPQISFGYNIFYPKVFGFSAKNQDPIKDLCKLFKQYNVTIDPNGYYPVYIQEQSSGDYGSSVDFCAWHNAAFCDGVQFTYGLFFDMSDPNFYGCGASLVSTYNNSIGLATWANTGVHELFEMTTDPLIADAHGDVNVTGWLNFEGNEIADLCAWTLLPVQVGEAVFSLQGLWSNSEYATQSGYFNEFDDEKGCSVGG